MKNNWWFTTSNVLSKKQKKTIKQLQDECKQLNQQDEKFRKIVDWLKKQPTIDDQDLYLVLPENKLFVTKKGKLWQC